MRPKKVETKTLTERIVHMAVSILALIVLFGIERYRNFRTIYFPESAEWA